MIWPNHATHIILLPLCYSMLMNNRLGRSPLLSRHLVLTQFPSVQYYTETNKQADKPLLSECWPKLTELNNQCLSSNTNAAVVSFLIAQF